MDAAPNDNRESFATYLARYHVARSGFAPGAPPEAAALAAACDIILSSAQGSGFEILCIVDCEAHPHKRFELPGDEVRRIARDCLKYAGSAGLSTYPVTVRIYEVGLGLDTKERRGRLQSLRKLSALKTQVSAWILDTSSKSVWTTVPFNGRFQGRPTLEGLLRRDRIDASQLQPPLPVAAAPPGQPFVTYALLLIIASVFACELVFGLGGFTKLLEPTIATLTAMGGSQWPLVVEQREWYRGISAGFLHVNVMHLALNSFVLFFAGRQLERAIGHAWFGATYAVSAICGSLMSLVLNPTNIVSVGASGAIMGILAAAFVCSFRFPPGAIRTRLQTTSLQVLIPSLLPLVPAASGHQVDFGAHLGGALGGALVGAAMLLAWPREAQWPKLRTVAAAIAVAWALGGGYAALTLSQSYAQAQRLDALRALLIPEKDLPSDGAAVRAQAETLAAQYPRDPRSHYYRAVIAYDRRNWPEAERALRTALDEQEILTLFLTPSFHEHLQGLLALVLSEQGRTAEAKAVAKPVCGRSQLMPNNTYEAYRRLCE